MQPSEEEARFVRFLEGLAAKGPRAALAACLRGLGKPPGAAPQMLLWLAPWTVHLGRREAERRFLIASLFAFHPRATREGNVGTTLAGVRGGKISEECLERRFVALLNAHAEDLPGHLRHAISLARSGGRPVNWAQLLADLRHWEHPEGVVQMAWARGFWGATAPRSIAAEDHGLTVEEKVE